MFNLHYVRKNFAKNSFKFRGLQKNSPDMNFIPRPSKKLKNGSFYFRVDVVLRDSVVLVLELEVDAPERVDLLSATFGAGLLAGFGAGFAFGAGF